MRVVISGYGKMGRMVEQVLSRRGIECVCATEDVLSVDDALASECVCIDFTTPEAFRNNFAALARKFKAVVVGTTGWYDIKDEVFAAFKQAGATLIWASNFSIGVNAFFAALERAASVLNAHNYSASVNEIHHIHKLDAPSGTAKTAADIVAKAMAVQVPISSERIGEVPGIHSVEFVSEVDKLNFTHEAFSRQGFAEGAVAAALLTEEVSIGVYEFKDLII